MVIDHLYNIAKRQYIRICKETKGSLHPPAHREFEPEEVLFFDHLDGMYSYCIDKEGNTVHLAAYQAVEVVEDQEWRHI